MVVVCPGLVARTSAQGGARSWAGKPASALALATRALDRGLDSTVEAALALEVSHALITEHTPEVAASKEEFGQR